MDPETGIRYRQPPRPPVRPFPNPTPQREGLVKRLPTWSSRRAIPHTVPDADLGMPQVYTERTPDLVPEQVPGGTFGKIVASEEDQSTEKPYPFHYDIPPPLPFTNCPKQYISGNITRKLPFPKGPLRAPKAPSAAIPPVLPSSIPRPNTVAVPVQSRPSPSTSVQRQAPPPPPPGPPPTRPAPPPPTSRPYQAGPAPPVSNTNPAIRRTRRPPPSPGIRPPHIRPPQTPAPNMRAPTPPKPDEPVSSHLPPDHPLFNARAAASNPDIERANWFRNKLATDLDDAAINNPDFVPAMQDTLSQLDALLGDLSLASTDEQYSATVSSLEGIFEYIQSW